MQVNSFLIWFVFMNYDHNKKFGLLKFHSGYGKFNLNIPKGYSLKIINTQTGAIFVSKCFNISKASYSLKTYLANI